MLIALVFKGNMLCDRRFFDKPIYTFDVLPEKSIKIKVIAPFNLDAFSPLFFHVTFPDWKLIIFLSR